jgi:hypothetical protein
MLRISGDLLWLMGLPMTAYLSAMAVAPNTERHPAHGLDLTFGVTYFGRQLPVVLSHGRCQALGHGVTVRKSERQVGHADLAQHRVLLLNHHAARDLRVFSTSPMFCTLAAGTSMAFSAVRQAATLGGQQPKCAPQEVFPRGAHCGLE